MNRMKKNNMVRTHNVRDARARRWLTAAFSTALAFMLVQSAPAADTGTSNASNQPRILTVENVVHYEPAGARSWQAAKPGQLLATGDRVRTGKDSRATVRLADQSVVRVNALTTFELLPPHLKDRKSMIDLKSGSLYFFSREKPLDIQFRTPTAVGAIRGTEFHVAVAENGETHLALLDGAVDLENEAGRIEMHSGEQARVAAGQAPAKSPLLDATNIIQWCLYYPAVVDTDELPFTAPEKESLRESLAAYRAGDLSAALRTFPAGPAGESAQIYHAALLLSVGRVDEASRLLATSPATGPAQALRELIAAVQFKEFTRTAPPATASEWLAESYYQQSRARLDEALAAARQAAAKSPTFGFASVRVAELEFSFARVSAAEAALATGLRHSPRHAPGLALRGFLHAASGRMSAAFDSFDEAIGVDGALGNAWLGRGLVRIRQGQHAEGRQDLQTAAALEPNRSIIRSYLAKAWSADHQDALAQKDLRLARQLDPNDPTPWLYSALLDQQHNQINSALRALQKSQELNDHQALFRSKLLLDQDRAVRSANLAAIYRDAGMEDVSVREAAKAVNADYANYSAHLFLANSYDTIRDPKLFNLRYEAPARSEWLIANLLAPVGAGTLSRNISQQDYIRLFERDGFGISSATEYRSHGEWVESASQFGRFGRVGYALDTYYRSDQGQRRNNDLEHLQLNGQFKFELTPQDSVFLTVEYFKQESGDVAQHFNPATANPGLRVTENQDPNVFIGYHREWSPNLHTLLLVGRLDDTLDLANPDAQPLFMRVRTNTITRVRREPFYNLDYRRDFEVYSAELQQIWQQDRHSVIMGGAYQNGQADTAAQLTALGTRMSSQKLSLDLERLSSYGYYQWRVLDPLALTAGLAYDRLTFPRNILNAPLSGTTTSEQQISPKGGLIFTPGPHTTLRGMYAQSLGGLFNENSFRLEPTQIGGLNQSWRSVIPESAAGLLPGAKIETWAVSLDHSFSSGTFLGLAGEWLNSEGERTVGAFTNSISIARPGRFSSTRQKLEFEERSLLFTANQLIGECWNLGARYRLSEASLESDYPNIPDAAIWQAQEPKHADDSALLQQLTLSLGFNHRSGFFARWQSHWSAQDNRGALAEQNFWQHDIHAGYRFLQRRAEVRVGVLNLADQDYRLNPLNLHAELPRQRTFVASAKFTF